MRNILVLIGEYYPYNSANGRITQELIETFNTNFKVFVLTRKTHSILGNYEKYKNTEILRINDWNLILQNRYKEKSKFKYLNRIKLHIVKIFFLIKRMLSRSSIDKAFSKKIYKKGLSISKAHHFDSIITVSAPHEEIYAGYLFKKNNPNLKLVIYQMDKFSNAISLYPLGIRTKRRYTLNLNIERKVYDLADKYFLLKPLEKYTRDFIVTDFGQKLTITEHPLLTDKSSVALTNNKIASVTYAGSLDKKMRNPEFYLKLVLGDKYLIENVLHTFYTFGNCGDILSRYKTLIGPNLKINERVPSHDLVSIMQKSDIILIFGNNSKDEIPSKLFEYMSYCKPIIYVYYFDEDGYLKYLEEYPNKLCLKVDSNNSDNYHRLLKNFFANYKSNEISYNQIELIYNKCTPKYVGDQIMNFLEITEE